MAQRLPVETDLVGSAEDLVDDFNALAANGMTPQEIACFRRQLQRHLTRVDSYAYERRLVRSMDRCGARGEWLRRELVRLWAATPEQMEVTPIAETSRG